MSRQVTSITEEHAIPPAHRRGCVGQTLNSKGPFYDEMVKHVRYKMLFDKKFMRERSSQLSREKAAKEWNIKSMASALEQIPTRNDNPMSKNHPKEYFFHQDMKNSELK